MRRLSYVKLVKSNYDPVNKTAVYTKAVDHYDANEGYTLEHHPDCVRVVHASNPTPLILSHDKVEYGLEMLPPAPAPEPKPQPAPAAKGRAK